MEQKGLRSQIDSNELQGGLGTVSEQAKSSIEITLAAESGLGYGEGSISHRAGTERVGIEVVKQAEAVINSSIILTDISVDSEGLSIEDDGCGDGREAGVILQGDTEIKKPSLNRAKVFGGGATMAVAARIGVDGLSEQTLGEEFKVAMDELDEKYIGFGAHTDSHAHGENCGCGAIDKAPEIIANTVKFRDQITATIKALGIEDDLTSVFEKFLDASIRTKDQEFSGKQVSESIKAHDKITKRLLGGHEEQYIVLILYLARLSISTFCDKLQTIKYRYLQQMYGDCKRLLKNYIQKILKDKTKPFWGN